MPFTKKMVGFLRNCGMGAQSRIRTISKMAGLRSRRPRLTHCWTSIRATAKEKTVTPRETTLEDIRRTVESFRISAMNAKRAGFDGVQLQAGFIYLFQQFQHETTNRRTDRYGGSIENRARFLFEVLDTVLEIWPSQRVGIKTGPMMSEQGVFKAIESTVPTV